MRNGAEFLRVLAVAIASCDTRVSRLFSRTTSPRMFDFGTPPAAAGAGAAAAAAAGRNP